jgi:hypothetical protein
VAFGHGHPLVPIKRAKVSKALGGVEHDHIQINKIKKQTLTNIYIYRERKRERERGMGVYERNVSIHFLK